MEGLVYDNLKWAKDKEILSIINKEILYYSNKIIKINHFGVSQERYIVLTDVGLYNFQKKKVKRKIKYDQIRGITYSKISNGFVIHGNDDEYDYQYQSNEKFLILRFIAKFYEEQNNQPLKICAVSEKSLKNFVTMKKDKKKDKNFSKMDETKIINTKKFLEETANSDKVMRNPSSNSMGEEEKINDEVPAQMKTRIIFSKIDNIQYVSLEDFKIVKIIGRGSLGKVYLAQFKKSKDYYAMKSIKRDYIAKESEMNNILEDKKIIQNLNYKFLIGTKLCFMTDERVYFIMNLINGQSLFDYMRTNKNNKEDQVKFYAAIIGLTIDYLHKNGIKYREITPDNIIIDKDGYLKIADFRMSKLFKIKDNISLMKENTEYLAPEVLNSTTPNSSENNPTSDWWSYGIILYELLFDVPPYFNEDKSKIKEQIIKNELRFPKGSNVSKGAKELLKKLLNKNPGNRLGHSKGFDEIKKQDFFKGFNFENLINNKIDAIYKPKNIDIIKNKEKMIEVSYDDLVNSKIINK